MLTESGRFTSCICLLTYGLSVVCCHGDELLVFYNRYIIENCCCLADFLHDYIYKLFIFSSVFPWQITVYHLYTEAQIVTDRNIS